MIISYTVREAAEKLGLTPQQVLNRIKRQKIKAKKKGWIWLVKPRDLEAIRKALAKKK